MSNGIRRPLKPHKYESSEPQIALSYRHANYQVLKTLVPEQELYSLASTAFIRLTVSSVVHTAFAMKRKFTIAAV